MSKSTLETIPIFAVIALGVLLLWYVPAVNHHADIVRVCNEKGYVNGTPFGEDIKCEEMKVEK